MSDHRKQLRRARRIVVKIGSNALLDEDAVLDEPQLHALVDQMAELHAQGGEVICVTSGAVAAGLRELGLNRRPRDLPSLQAAAAIGQARLIALYRDSFARYGVPIGQVLLVHDDLRARLRHLNASNTLSYLLKRKAVPILNENDSIAVDEIRFGDNDRLSALAACLIHADALIMLTTVDGLLDPKGEVVPCVKKVTAEIQAMARGASTYGTGGMASKLQAAQIGMRAGICCVIANAREPNVLPRVAGGEELGTLFAPQDQSMRSRRRWIAFFDKPQGALHIDAGAAKAMRERNSSLLPIGVVQVAGSFKVGATVSVVDETGDEIARGLVNYDSESIERIRGCKSSEIASILGTREYEEVIHRDNIVVA